MSEARTKTNSVNRLKISDETRRAYERREFWQGASIGKYYRPRKTQISFRIDDEVLDWLKSKGEGHLTRINEILRQRMTTERRKQ